MEACIDADEKTEAAKYIIKLADPREKAEVSLYLKYMCVGLSPKKYFRQKSDR